MNIPWAPVVFLDSAGSILILVLAIWCLILARQWANKKDDDVFRQYIFLLTLAIVLFAVSRSFGHLVKQVLLYNNMDSTWKQLSPLSGAINSVSFVVIFAFGIYFHHFKKIHLQIENYQNNLEEMITTRTEQLESAKLTLENVLNNTNPICITNTDFQLVQTNTAYRSIWPVTEEDIGAMKCYDSRPGTHCHTATCPLRQIMAGQQEVIHEASKKIRGRNMDFIATAKPFRNAAGELLGIVESFQDISANKQVEAALMISKRVIDNTSEGVIIADIEKRIIDVNPAYSEILDYTSQAVIGRELGFSLADRDDEIFYQQLWQSVAKDGKWAGELWDRKASGDVVPTHVRINTVYDEEKTPRHYVYLFADISQRKATEKQMEELAFFDPLTHLPNRRLFRERLQQQLTTARRNQTLAGLMFIDLDRFKYINDSLGHSAGDELLIQVGERLKKAVRESDTVARMGGDEFTVIITELNHKNDLAQLAEKMLERLKTPVRIANRDVVIGASIGIALYPENGTDNDELMKNADVAMYASKASGRNRYTFYSPQLKKDARNSSPGETHQPHS